MKDRNKRIDIMRTKHNILSLGLAAALVGTLALPAPKAHAGDDAGPILVGALIGGILGYVIGDADDGCDRVRVVHPAPVVYHPAPVVVVPPPPVVVHRPVVVVPPRPVVIYEPVVVKPHCPSAVVYHRPGYKRYDKDYGKHYDKPGHRYGDRNDRHPADFARNRPGGHR
jgi:hypothetical protein